jgi:hypothetical protein
VRREGEALVRGEERRGEVEREEEGFTQLLSGDWLRWSSTVGRPRGG